MLTKEEVKVGYDLSVKAKSRWARRFFGVPKVKAAGWGPGHRIYRDEEIIDREAEIQFERWACQLDEVICLCTWKDGLPKAGRKIKPYEAVAEDEVNIEEMSVYEWGRELNYLENKAMNRGDEEILRMHQIVEMFCECKLLWRGGPLWWRML